ncbi:protein kinase [Vermiconidia calcicola]|uniref:Protein kinase n=1 Tax=Vermiconidia calcicola TaxID=1690605 RepID=A0ACC3NWJ9_9PEZI|nr:protein kinase [Vermiconidia calcicola]
MAATDDLIDFNVIESHKENIQALPSGRSAKALAQIYSPQPLGAQPTPQDANFGRRQEFEKELKNIDEADDPLDVYDRYVKWTLDAYPSAQATPQSQLLPLLERATKTFQTSDHYKNDPRYLKLWLHYIRLFSDAPREVFVFLARHSIGESLALYYEEFAAWLENAGRWSQAEEIYKMGLEKEARPAERLLRKFGEFERRNAARPHDAAEPSSPALPAARPVLAAKIDPFAAAASPVVAEPQQSRASTTKKGKGSKVAIFSDSDESSRPSSGAGESKGWDNIGSLADRKKENAVEAKPWVGEKLKGGKTNGGMQKMMVFKDQSLSQSKASTLPRHLSSRSKHSSSSSAHEQQCVRNPKTGRMECVFVNLEAVYPDIGKKPTEYCFEELRARHRGWLSKRRRAEVPKAPVEQPKDSLDLHQTEIMEVDEPQQVEVEIAIHEPEPRAGKRGRGFKIFEDALEVPSVNHTSTEAEDKVLVETFSKTLALNDENDENAPLPRQRQQQQDAADLAKKLRREERANRTRKIKVMDVKHIKNETKTIQLNLDSPTGPKLKRKKSADRPEPTMTINTKEAMDEIYGIFNQPLPSQAEQTDGEDEESEDDDGDYTSGGESTGTGKLSNPASEYGDETRNEILGAHAVEKDARTSVSSWSDFTASKHVPKGEQDGVGSAEETRSGMWEVYQDQTQDGEDSALPGESMDDIITPVDDENPQTRYVPLPPEGYEPSMGQYRDTAILANNRLPFMTPIVEQTESSLGMATGKSERRDYFSSAKTPSRKAGVPPPLLEDDPLGSSPFQEVIAADRDDDEDKRKVLQPIRTKSTKGTISLGQGTAKNQIAAKVSRKTPSVAEPLQKGPVIADEQCNPMDSQVRQTILAQMKPSLTSFEGYHEHHDMSSGRTAEIKKYIRTLQKASRSSVNLDKTASTLSLPPMLTFRGGDGTYTIKRELGAGTFAPVYLVENSAALSAEEAGENDENRPPSRVGRSAHRKSLEAVKMEEPPSTWEFYILRQSHRRLGVSRAAESIVRAHEMHLFRDECFLVEEYRDQGTLLDLVNTARLDSGSGAGGMEEPLAMWLTVELLRTVEALHSKHIIHGDLKGDNVLVRFDDPGAETDWSPTYFPSGAHGWSSKGICLIDMGRGIDMKQFPPTVAFIADWKTTEADCAEMRELRPWTYQIDYHGLAGIIHSLLFGKYMETIGEKGGTALGQNKTYRIREGLKRYWQTEIWGEVFHLLLNPLAHLDVEEGRRMPVVRGMRACRERMEAWLEENCERGVGLKAMIGRMEGLIRERRRKSVKAL